MAEPARQPEEQPRHGEDATSGDEVRYLPVRAEGIELEAAPARPIEPAGPAPLPAAAVAAVGGFMAGVATFVMVRVLRQRRAQRALGRMVGRRRRGERLDIAGSRSFLVDIHLLRR